ncbi:MAG: DUF86 domain-containing protein [Planctomycetota bacterium]|nr:DUF86 domain-containing protein [Planctomycetota bacterium]
MIPSLLYDLVASGEAILELRRGGALLSGSPAKNTELAAILYNFVVMGEIASRLGEDFLAQHPELPWRQVIDHRNVIAHGYDDVDPEILARTIDEHLPDLVAKAQRILETYGPPPETDQ